MRPFPMHATLVRRAALAMSMLCLAACSSGHDRTATASAAAGTSTQISSASFFDSMAGIRPSPVAPERGPRSFNLCRLLPSDTVAQVLRSTVGRKVDTAATLPGGMCSYREGSAAAPSVRVAIDIGRDRSAAAAGVTLLGVRGQLGANGIATTDIPGIAEMAFGSSDTTGRYTVMLQQGAMTGRVTVEVKGAEATSLRPAAVELAKRTLTALR